MVELDALFDSRQVRCILLFLDVWQRVQDFEHPAGSGNPLLDDVVDAGQSPYGFVEHEESGHEGEEVPRRALPVHDAVSAVEDYRCGTHPSEHLRERGSHRLDLHHLHAQTEQLVVAGRKPVHLVLLGSKGLHEFRAADRFLQVRGQTPRHLLGPDARLSELPAEPDDGP